MDAVTHRDVPPREGGLGLGLGLGLDVPLIARGRSMGLIDRIENSGVRQRAQQLEKERVNLQRS